MVVGFAESTRVEHIPTFVVCMYLLYATRRVHSLPRQNNEARTPRLRSDVLEGVFVRISLLTLVDWNPSDMGVSAALHTSSQSTLIGTPKLTFETALIENIWNRLDQKRPDKSSKQNSRKTSWTS